MSTDSSERSKRTVHPRNIKRIEVLGRGHFGVVFKCVYDQHEVYAVKFLREPEDPASNAATTYALNRKAISDHLRRASSIETNPLVWKDINHKNILLPHAFGISSSGDPMIVSQYADLGDLSKVLRKKQLSVQRRVLMAIEVALGMNYLHNKTPVLLHLDLKPANIMVFRDYQIKIGDLGLAEILQAERGSIRKARGHTPAYAAPEALTEGKEITTKTDVFSFGMVLYEMFFFRQPFSLERDQGCRQFDVATFRMVYPNRRPSLDAPPENIPSPLIQLINACWKDSPQERPDFSEIIGALRSIREHLISTEGPLEPDSVPSELPSRNEEASRPHHDTSYNAITAIEISTKPSDAHSPASGGPGTPVAAGSSPPQAQNQSLANAYGKAEQGAQEVSEPEGQPRCFAGAAQQDNLHHVLQSKQQDGQHHELQERLQNSLQGDSPVDQLPSPAPSTAVAQQPASAVAAAGPRPVAAFNCQATSQLANSGPAINQPVSESSGREQQGTQGYGGCTPRELGTMEASSANGFETATAVEQPASHCNQLSTLGAPTNSSQQLDGFVQTMAMQQQQLQQQQTLGASKVQIQTVAKPEASTALVAGASKADIAVQIHTAAPGGTTTSGCPTPTPTTPPGCETHNLARNTSTPKPQATSTTAFAPQPPSTSPTVATQPSTPPMEQSGSDTGVPEEAGVAAVTSTLGAMSIENALQAPSNPVPASTVSASGAPNGDGIPHGDGIPSLRQVSLEAMSWERPATQQPSEPSPFLPGVNPHPAYLSYNSSDSLATDSNDTAGLSPFDCTLSVSMRTNAPAEGSGLASHGQILLQSIFPEGQEEALIALTEVKAKLAEMYDDSKHARRLMFLLEEQDPGQAYTLTDLTQLMSELQKGWVVGAIDLLPLPYEATDWLLGGFTALRLKHGAVERVQLESAVARARERGRLEDEDVDDIQGALGKACPKGGEVVLMKLLERLTAMTKATAEEERSAQKYEYEQEQKIRDFWDACNKQWEQQSIDLEFLNEKKKSMGDRYAEGLFITPQLVDDATRTKMFAIMRASRKLWIDIQDYHSNGLLPDKFWNQFKDRGRLHRTLVEPLDIANWYYSKKNKDHAHQAGEGEQGYHYAYSINTEEEQCTVHNKRRPSRYAMLQALEKRLTGKAESSMDSAYRLARLLKDKSWEEVNQAQQPQHMSASKKRKTSKWQGNGAS